MYNSKIAGSFIRSAREARGFKQDYIAFKLNLSQNGYSKTELGKSQLTIDRLLILSDILHFDISEMLMHIEVEGLK